MTQPVPTAPPAPPVPPVPTPNPAPASDPGPQPDPPTSPPSDENRRGGEKAILADLAKEREKRHQLEERLSKLSPLEKLAEAMSNGQRPPEGKSEVDLLREKFDSYEKDLQTERQARWRLEAARDKGLSPEQASWLQGDTQEELLASADKLLAAFPAAASRTPAPDPTQGGRGGTPGPDIDAQVAEARSKGDFRRAINLERQKLNGLPRPV